MHPFIDLGFVKIPMYGVMIASAYLVSYLYLVKRGKDAGFDKSKISDIMFYIVLWGFIGAKILYIFTFYNDFGNNFYERFINIFTLTNLRAGFVFYGGFISASIFVYYYSQKNKINFFKLADFFAPAIPLAHSIGRLGCFFAGCCHGRETNSFLGVVFTSPYCEVDVSLIGHKIHPTQLYESIGNFMIFLFLNRLSKNKNLKEGSLIFGYFISYSFLRFIVEFFRGDNRGGYWLGYFSQAQLISIWVIIFSFIFLRFYVWKNKK
ncbi:MAG: prolipoprotein diacylglyceryl transferase [Elusimicrobiota bacterium]